MTCSTPHDLPFYGIKSFMKKHSNSYDVSLHKMISKFGTTYYEIQIKTGENAEIRK